ncbi:MAG: energy transducer TonB, partial [Porphyromonadaceae bacterium]|nr:energy transducer TonB [Porphyromonadaceae bacterium]
VNEVTTLAKLPDAEIKRNQELQPAMRPATPPPPLKSTIKFTAPVIKKDEELNDDDEIKSQDELAARGNTAISVADVIGNDEIDGQDIADFKDYIAPEEEEEEVYIVVEQMPGFPGGEEALLKYIRDHMQYPSVAIERGIEGRVTVRFVVNKEGYVQDVTVVRGVHELLDREAVRVIQSLPRWNPGKQNGTAVSVYYNVPVNFTLQ